VVELLEKRGFIRARETVREGRRPERTIYEITEPGARELNDWLTELVAQPVKEYLQFEAALSLLPVLPPDVAVDVLKERKAKLEVQLGQMQGAQKAALDAGIPRLFEIEAEYVEALARAELEFVGRLVKDIESGELEGLDLWRSFLAGDDVTWHPPEDPEP
jgi:DNA-binding PadR family transcriptional regulator